MHPLRRRYPKSERAAERLLESSTKYLEEMLKLRVSREKSRTVSVYAIRNFKYLGFCFGKPERMVVPADTDVYLETVETAQNPEEKADGTGITGMGCL